MRALSIAVLLLGCNGREATPDCGAADYCHDRNGVEMCCIPGAFPYCGRAGTDCAPGFCCSSPPRRVEPR